MVACFTYSLQKSSHLFCAGDCTRLWTFTGLERCLEFKRCAFSTYLMFRGGGAGGGRRGYTAGLQGFSCKGEVWKPKVVMLFGTLRRSTSCSPKTQVTLKKDVSGFPILSFSKKDPEEAGDDPYQNQWRRDVKVLLLPSLDRDPSLSPRGLTCFA